LGKEAGSKTSTRVKVVLKRAFSNEIGNDWAIAENDFIELEPEKVDEFLE
jgi:hypothetical protein